MGEVRFRVKLLQAARLAGKHKTTILRAIQSGRLSATEGPDGHRRIDVAELHRVYGPLRTDAVQTAARIPTQPDTPPDATGADTVALLAELRNQIARLEADKAALRTDLDAERDERRRLVAIVERLLLTDQRSAPATPAPETTETAAPTTPRRRRVRPIPAPAPAAAPAAGFQPVVDAVTTWWRGR